MTHDLEVYGLILQLVFVRKIRRKGEAMHQALYRKWRPKTFDEVCGQDHITSVLRYEVKEGTVNHAYLFCGSRGTGKTSCAKILAKAVNCLSPANGNPCGKCAACLSIEAGTATDVLEMDAASNNGVENIRDIRDEVMYSPSSLRYRVYIVDEVHMLSQSAFNALLKTLEEPPAHVVFILATTELQKLPATIISRCQRFDFRRIAAPVLASRISYIAKKEGLDLAPAAAERIARMAQGGMRDAISLLELCAGTPGTITPDTVNEFTGSTGRTAVAELARAVAAGDLDAVFGAVAEATASARDLSVFWQDLMAFYRDLLVLKTVKDPAKYLDLTDTEAAELHILAQSFGKGQLLSHCKLLEDAFLAMQKAGAVKRMIAELALLRMCDPALDTGVTALLARVEKLEDTVARGAFAPGQTQASPPAVTPPAPKSPETICETPQNTAAEPGVRSPGERTLHRVRGFAGCVERVRRSNSMLASFLENAKAFVDETGHVVVQLPNAFAKTLLDNERDQALLAGALSAELHKELTVREIVLEVPDPAIPASDRVIDDLLSAANETESKTQ